MAGSEFLIAFRSFRSLLQWRLSRCRARYGLGTVSIVERSGFTAKISFGIYIWQDPVISAVKAQFPSAFGPISDDLLYGWLLWSLLAAALVFVIASLSYIFIERPVLLRAHAVPR